MKKHDLFGLSSFIFIIASIYTILVVSSSYYFYTIFLILLPILSYLCNTRYNVFYQKLDHINTLCIGLSYLFISHDLRVVRHMADRIVVMHQGKIVEQGSTKGIYERPKANYTRELLNAIPGKHFKFKVS